MGYYNQKKDGVNLAHNLRFDGSDILGITVIKIKETSLLSFCHRWNRRFLDFPEISELS
jgi:hypothetical protein